MVLEQDQRLVVTSKLARISVTDTVKETVFKKLLACLVDNLKAVQAGTLLLYDPSGDRLVVQAAYGYSLTDFDQAKRKSSQERCRSALRATRIELYSPSKPLAMDPTIGSGAAGDGTSVAEIDPYEPQSAAYLPLIAGKMKLGVLVLENFHDADGFSLADLPFLQNVADLVSLSAEGVRLRDHHQALPSTGDTGYLKTELISTLAHEMRTPLTSIKGYSSALLMEDVTFSPETQREFLQFIDEECDTLQVLIHDLLESSIMDAGLLKLELQPVKLQPLVKNVVDDLARRTETHRFVVDFPENFPILEADPDRLVQVLRNLLDNAVKYSPEGGLIVVQGEKHPDEVIVSVADQGVGLAPEHLNRLFEKFFRAKSSLNRHVVGSGLGLPISRTIVESHGGRIWAESQVGEGTTLFFTLPIGNLSQELEDWEESSYE